MITFVNKMLERILLILKTRNLSASQFADEINVQRSSISHILSGRNNPSLEFILKIVKKFPEIDIEWLLTGKGQMIKTDTPPQIKVKEPDLFTSEAYKEEKEEENLKEEIIYNEINNNSFAEDILPNSKIELKQEIINDNHAKSKTNRIEKIVFFNSDRTFTEYYPES